MTRLLVRLTPRSSQNRIEITGETAQAWVSAAPTDGQANAALIRLVAQAFGIAPSRIRLVRGHTSREKTLEIEGVEGEPSVGPETSKRQPRASG